MPQDKSWMKQSDAVAKELTFDQAQYSPELGSFIGFRQFDDKGMVIQDDMESLELALFGKWQKRLKKMLEEPELHPEYETDLKLMLDEVEKEIEAENLYQEFAIIPFYPLVTIVYRYLQQLVNPQSSAERKSKAVARFSSYVQGRDGFKPLALAFESRTRFLKEKYKEKKIIWPYHEEGKQYFKDADGLLKGIEEVLEGSGTDSWKDDYELFKKQVEQYHDFLKNEVLPEMRHEYSLPREYYQHCLRKWGVKEDPEELIRLAKEDFDLNFKKFEEIAAKLATKYELKENTPKAVLDHLKKIGVKSDSQAIEKMFREAAEFLDKLIEKEQLITLPKKPLYFRMAGDAETRAAPFPHVNIPPFVNNQGEQPEFVLPSAIEGFDISDDCFEAVAPILTAHEARPGHELQFARVLEDGISIARSLYGQSLANVEGWGLYSEWMVYPYISLEAQMGALQFRVWRNARLFVDPMLHLGQMKPDEVKDLYINKLGFSEELTKVELRRYLYEIPGQATCYYYGMKRFLALRERMEKKLGDKFNQKTFHDKIISLGFLDFELMDERVERELN